MGGHKNKDIICISGNFFIANRKGRGCALLRLPDRVILDELSMGYDESGLQRHFVSICKYGEVNA
ncbi:MAG: hypothetical protein RJA20_2601 [Bacteroidota bacterium]|jgi:hypothetical protein